jgi:hypothetical protein
VATTEAAPHTTPMVESSAVPWYAYLGGVIFWGLVVIRGIRAMRKGRGGSVETLVRSASLSEPPLTLTTCDETRICTQLLLTRSICCRWDAGWGWVRSVRWTRTR